MAVNNKLIYENQCGNVGIGTDDINTKLHISGDFDGSSNYGGNNPNKGILIEKRSGVVSDYSIDDAFGIDFTSSSNATDTYPVAGIYAVTKDVASFNGGELHLLTKCNTDATLQSRMMITRGGNIGINQNNPTIKLEVVDTNNEILLLKQTAGPASYMTIGPNNNTGAKIGYDNTGSADLATIGHHTVGNVININSSGNVGIGTAPDHTLHVKDAADNAVVEVETSATNGNPAFRLKNDAQEWQWQLRGAESDSLVAWDVTGGAGRLYLTTSGRLAIGHSNPAATLHVEYQASTPLAIFDEMLLTSTNTSQGAFGSQRWGWYGTAWSRNASSCAAGWGSGFTGGDGDFGVHTVNSACAQNTDMNSTNLRFVVKNDGNVGIGTDNPLLKLHVQGDVTGGAYNQAVGQIVISGASNTNKRLNIGFDTSTDKAFLQSGINGTGYNDLLLNPNGGNVGIGTSSPDYDLHVQDDVEANIKIETNNDGASNFAGLRMFKSRGTNASPTSVANGDIVSQILFYPRDASGWNNTSRIIAKICGTVTSTDTPTDLIFSTGTTGLSDRLIIKSGGTVCAAGIMCAGTCFYSGIVCGSTYLASPYSSVSCAYSSVCLRTDGVFCIKGDDILFCEAAVNKDRFITIGPNSSWCGCLIVGSGEYPGDAVTRAHIFVTNGNLHIDSANSCLGNPVFTYLQWHAGCATIFGNGDCAQIGCIGCAGNLCTSSCVHSPVLCAGTRVNVGGSACIETGWFRNVNNNTGLYNVANALHWYTCLACEWKIQTSASASQINMGVCKDASATCITAGYVYANNNCEIMFLNNSHVRVLAACPNCHATTACTHCAKISCGTTCSISPIVCGSSCVKGVITCGATCVISPIICGAGCTVADGELRVDRICGLNVGGDSGQQVTGAGGGSVYQWGYQAGGLWASPFPDLVIGYHTGLILGANCSYGGTRFYSDHPHSSAAQIIFLVGCGNCNVCACYNLCAAGGVYSPIICATTTMQVGGNDVLTTASSVGANFCAGTDVNNRVVTANGASGSLCGEANMTFDGSTLNVTGAITASGDITSTSDCRVKSDINSIDCAIFIVNGLCGRRYIKDNKKQIGIIAQEAENILPEIVFEGNDENKMKSVSYGNITAVLIEAIKEQQKEINVLRKELDFLKSSKEE